MRTLYMRVDDMRTLQPKLEGEKWDWEQNPILAGICTDIMTLTDENGEEFRAVQVYTRGEPAFFFGSAALDSQLEHAEPPCVLYIRYLGVAQSKRTRHQYRNFEVRIAELPPDMTPENCKVYWDPERQQVALDYDDSGEEDVPF